MRWRRYVRKHRSNHHPQLGWWKKDYPHPVTKFDKSSVQHPNASSIKNSWIIPPPPTTLSLARFDLVMIPYQHHSSPTLPPQWGTKKTENRLTAREVSPETNIRDYPYPWWIYASWLWELTVMSYPLRDWPNCCNKMDTASGLRHTKSIETLSNRNKLNFIPWRETPRYCPPGWSKRGEVSGVKPRIRDCCPPKLAWSRTSFVRRGPPRRKPIRWIPTPNPLWPIPSLPIHPSRGTCTWPRRSVSRVTSCSRNRGITGPRNSPIPWRGWSTWPAGRRIRPRTKSLRHSRGVPLGVILTNGDSAYWRYRISILIRPDWI